MRVISFVAMCAILVAAVAPSRADSSWQTYVSPEGRFAVLLPAVPPKTESSPITLWDRVTKSVLFDFSDSVGNDRVNYTVMYGDVPSSVFANFFNGSAESLLAHARDSALRQGRTLLTDAPISLNGNPGRAFSARDAAGNLYVVHYYFANNRFYQLIVVSTPGCTATDIDAFMASFQISSLGEPLPVVAPVAVPTDSGAICAAAQ